MKKKRSLWSLIIWACCTVSTLSAWASPQSTGNPATTQTSGPNQTWHNPPGVVFSLHFVADQPSNGTDSVA